VITFPCVSLSYLRATTNSTGFDEAKALFSGDIPVGESNALKEGWWLLRHGDHRQ